MKFEFNESVAPHRPFGRRLFGTMSEDAGSDSDGDLDKKMGTKNVILIKTYLF